MSYVLSLLSGLGQIFRVVNHFFEWLAAREIKQQGRNEVELEIRRRNDELEDALDCGLDPDNVNRVRDDEITR